MTRKIITSVIISLLCVTGFAQSGIVEVSGVKSEFMVTKKLHGKGPGVFVTTTGSNMQFTIESIDPQSIYIIGVNNRITMFKPVENGVVKIDASNDKFVLEGNNKKINTLINELCYRTFYSAANHQLNTYMTHVVCGDLVKVDKEEINREDYSAKIMQIRDQSLADINNAKLKDKVLKEQLKSLVNEWYWESIFSGYVLLKHYDIDVNQTLLTTIDGYNMDNKEFLKDPLADMKLYNYLRVQQDLGRIKVTTENHISEQAACIKDLDVREYYVICEIKRLLAKGELMFIEQLAATCESYVLSDNGKAEYKKLTDRIANFKRSANRLDGVVAMDFEYEDQNGKPVKLSDFRGKYVYIDFWATWCGPCKQEIPYLVELERELAGENIVFLSVSMDKQEDKEKWKTFLTANKMHGVTLISPSGMNTEFARKYNITSIPRFMLIDPKGVMVSKDCWRPRDPRLKEYLLTLLKK